VTVCDLDSGGASVFQLEEDESGSGDPGDAAGVEADPAQSFERDFEQGVRTFGDAVDAANHLVERLLFEVEFAALGLLDGVAEARAGVLVPEVGQRGDVQCGGEPVQGVDQAVGTGTGGVVLASGADWGDPQWPAVRGGDDLYVPAVVLVLSRPPQVGSVRAGCGDAVGADDRAVQVEVGVSGGRRPLQRGGQVGSVVGEHGQPLVQVSVGGGHRDLVVPGELGKARAVDEPPQHEDALPEGPESAGVLAGAEPLAVLAEQTGQGLGCLPADIEHSGVGDTGQYVKPLAGKLIFADLFLPGVSLMSDTGSPGLAPVGACVITYRNRQVAEKPPLTVDELIMSVFDHYDRLWPRIEELITAHAAEDRGSMGLVLEGSALWPVRVARLQVPHTAAVWLTTDDSLVRARVHAAGRYEAATGQEQVLMDKFLARTERYQALMIDAIDRLGLARIDAGGGQSAAELADTVLAAVDAQTALGR
jgi:hypothetical protein